MVSLNVKGEQISSLLVEGVYGRHSHLYRYVPVPSRVRGSVPAKTRRGPWNARRGFGHEKSTISMRDKTRTVLVGASRLYEVSAETFYISLRKLCLYSSCVQRDLGPHTQQGRKDRFKGWTLRLSRTVITRGRCFDCLPPNNHDPYDRIGPSGG